MAAKDRFYCIDNLHVLSVLRSLLQTRCNMNISIRDFFTIKKDGSTGPTALKRDGPHSKSKGP